MHDPSQLLKRVSLFKGLDQEALNRLAKKLRSLEFPKDALVVGQDSVGDSLYIIQRGRVKVVLYGEGGREMILSIFRTSDFFGEMSLLDGEPRSANVIALEECRFLVLSREDFVEQLQAFPHSALEILAEMSRRLRNADAMIGNLALLDVYTRLARFLIDTAKREGRVEDEGIVIRERMTQQNIASMIGASRETVSRVLSEFQKRGFVAIQDKQIIVSHGFVEQQFDSGIEK